ncbi:MgtC/SapB family protein [Paenibacillus sp. N1-5-1-14]|uniref:MgtC/SapB family protein n=1 Tax=Paenibacillus radicibacter TaxID=2972488 RepID=UPI002159A66D|nr:MgtC/SapB family protein [Paenibacillus radicibacter]MCR8643848.1 MgtC/SapB family protein [Paenibacillus radicibacter]
MVTIELTPETMVFRLLLAAVLGGIIGWERERKNKQAGLKTHLLVAVGSSLIMLTSIYGFGNDLLDHPNARFDPARLAAQVVSGIGFLGAGAILRRSNNVISGLTTAATLWVVAAIGLSVGAGFYWPAVVTILIIMFIIMIINKLESKLILFKKYGSLKVVMSNQPQGVEVINSLLQKEKITVEQMAVKREMQEDNHLVFMEFRIHTSKRKGMLDLFEHIWMIDGIKEVNMDWKE